MFSLKLIFGAVAIYAILTGTYGAALLAALMILLIIVSEFSFENENSKLKSKSEIED